METTEDERERWFEDLRPVLRILDEYPANEHWFHPPLTVPEVARLIRDVDTLQAELEEAKLNICPHCDCIGGD